MTQPAHHTPRPGRDGASLSDLPTKRYEGVRTPAGVVVVRVDEADRTRPLPARLDLRAHSPGGMEWGYAGSGPAQLALAILADAVGPDAARACYQRFKFEVIARLAAEQWELSRAEVLAWYQTDQATHPNG